MAESKVNKLDEAMKLLNKKYGEGSLIGGDTIPRDLKVVDTGSLTLNLATKCGGFPVGKLVELQGPESSGKSSLSLHAISNFQKKFPERKVMMLDYEASLDPMYAEAIGVDLESLIVCSPECAEDGYNMAESMIKTGEISLVVIDSHTAALPRAVVDADVGTNTIAMQARINSIAIAKIKPLLMVNNCTMICVSQLRANLGGYMVTQNATGGNAFKFYADMRMKVSRKVDAEAKKDESNETTVEVFKNKCGVPFGKATFNIIWGKGIDRKGEVIDIATQMGLVKRGGAYYSINESTKFQGMAKLMEFMEDNPEFFEELEGKVLNHIKNPNVEHKTD